MERKVFSKDGKEIGTINLDDRVFNIEISHGSIYNAIKNELSNLRVGTSSTKTRSEVRGSSKKPWKQKGTGRARVGTKRNPVWIGGGIALGPKPRDYSYRLPKKVKKLAFKSVLSLRAADENSFKVIENFSVESGKTKDLALIIKNFASFNGKVVILLGNDDQMIKRAGKNIRDLKILSFDKLRVVDLFYAKNLIALESAVNKLNEFYIK
ncbi:50S ribosomal protein L4 [Borreliella burgdorferi]|uniref:Large ribosomal subunit protein uL4 n=1 Tax=Borreliella burgdorferi (strain ZS7) TaxID=445985 RepID=RL4_BORBZ|nr:50S ribosomal protein L4 [Borreliella burgdorferi]B7J244.1 RecName: Full=Large ribosomal subunit protein uL4; AltName: Full=50S ribosomal protein L4 [Borreliella burgdorferi ZS7]ACK74663.1 ribosomal protein L4/L1 family protein [Borreliella burgdorferi ZS7]ATH10025.1 50S ribosomal protein L4 [Borreliella burgdorferi]EEF82929.1 50S ribosomal protein L4 [Borreliella burgdorferi WI91-23]EEH31731.1 50S ribosomal protein L4 [Borreliella burgdorferi Bol26]MCD2380066.1 50S ribosomal protein L4 [B